MCGKADQSARLSATVLPHFMHSQAKTVPVSLEFGLAVAAGSSRRSRTLWT